MCGRSDYFGLRQIAEEAVLRIIDLNRTQGPIVKPSRLFEVLETREQLEKAIDWLENRLGAPTNDVYKYAKLRFEESGRFYTSNLAWQLDVTDFGPSV